MGNDVTDLKNFDPKVTGSDVAESVIPDSHIKIIEENKNIFDNF